MRKLYIFNPDHDLALASDSDHFDAPQSAKIFARDFSLLPLWFCSEESAIYTENKEQNPWFINKQICFPQLKNCSIVTTVTDLEEIIPWGWDKTVRRKFEKLGAMHLPSIEQMSVLRDLQHRKMAIEATAYLQRLHNKTLHLAKPALLLTSAEIEAFVSAHPYAIFKAPWSGSGKGIVRSLGCLSENLLNRVKNIAEKQGGVIAEPLYSVIQDFAMEFSCEKGHTNFAGYSWFFTNEHGAYQGNLLASNEFIVKKLQKWILFEDINLVKQALQSFISEHIAPNYSGYVGVDMFIYKEKEQFFLHPCVEFNLRMTMGLVARFFYDKFVEYGKTGLFSVDFYNKSNELLKDHTKQSSKSIQIINGKIREGYFSLTPVTECTHYRARVEIT